MSRAPLLLLPLGHVKAIHFDKEVNTCEQLSNLLDDLKQVPRNTTTTVFLFVPPQKLAEHKELRLLACNDRNVLQMILIDEQHGMDFRHEIRTVFDQFLRPLMKRKKLSLYDRMHRDMLNYGDIFCIHY